MIYEFMDNDGNIHTAPYPMSEAPDIGTVVTIETDDGPIEATRIMSRNVQVQGNVWKPYVSNRLPRNLKGCACTPEGKPIVQTQAEERNIMAKFGYERE